LNIYSGSFVRLDIQKFRKDFKEILIWQRSHQFTLDIYKISVTFPPEEKFGLTSQIRRASYSIPTNIAEGCGRNTEADMCRFFIIAMGSASELEYQLLLVKDLGYLPSSAYNLLLNELIEIKKMLNAFIQKLKKSF